MVLISAVKCVIIIFQILLPDILAARLSYQDEQGWRFKPIYYNREELQLNYTRYKSHNTSLNISFHALNRDFFLNLHAIQPSSIEYTVNENHTKSSSYKSSILVGQVTGLRDSLVTCTVQNGILQGIISSKGQETFYILPTSWVFKSPAIFLSVIYSDHDFKRDSSLHQFIKTPPKSFISLQHCHEGRKPNFSRGMGMPRERRSIAEETSSKNTVGSFQKRVCTIKFTTDPFVWRHVMDKHGQNKIRAVNEIHYMIRDHMKVLNDVFEGTKFTVNHGKADEFTINGFQFEVGEIVIWNERHCTDDINLCTDKLTHIELLDLFHVIQYDHNFNDYDYEYPDYNYTDGDYNTNTDHNFTDYKDSDYPATSNIQKQHYCLSVLFTARSITHGLTPVPIYGLAYSPNDENPHTGICSPVNVAFVNLYVSEKVPYQPNTMTKLVFAHEVAHTFGAPHDNNKTACGEYSVLKESDAGYFLMHEVAVTGDLRNNFKFSNCSFDKIETVLARETSTSCFKEHKISICGNGIVEEGEQCDCGSRCHLDNCCHGRGTKHECALKQDAQCSPSQGPCCSRDTCQYFRESENMVCENAASCVDTLYCDGESATCPMPFDNQISPDNTTCRTDNARIGVCNQGNCNRSVCDLIGWHECELANGATKLTIKEKEELCYVGCQKTKSSQCISTNDASARAQFPELDHLLTTIAERDGWEDTSIRVPVGTPCNRMTGYCDVFQRCRGVDPDTPLSKLKRCFKQGGDCISVLLDFLSSKSGLIILAIVAGVILTFTCLVKCLSIHTKSSNPHLELKHPHKSVRESAIGVRHSVVRMGGSVRYSASHMRNSMRNSFRNSRRQSQTLSRENNRNVNDEDVQELKQLRPE
ncbi:disintegrin and metalloproteinase domain-containing protein 10-like isoform X2 [Mya arenaria]|uniref:disintegrin and metalloproteinase domain-containing protein 10-like isoform X2 n=1 Tax=Mya arenaria TaxID=6604 RepID=UPI0022E54BE6|nr:disintegrin and metalloproteinase domain-containing protein 10-like isoform X2 [Mya arenaria]